MYSKIINYLKSDVHLSEVISKSFFTTIIKSLGMIISLLVSIFLARTIGAEGLGVLNIANKIIAISLVVCMFGMRQVLIKEIAIGYNTRNFKLIGDSIKTAYIFNVGFSIFLSLLFISISPWLANTFFKTPELELVIALSFIVFPFQILSRIFSSGLNGYRKIWQAGLVDQTLSIFIVSIVLIFYFFIGIEISIVNVIISYIFARLVTSICLGIYWNILFKSSIQNNHRFSELISTAFSIFLVSVTSTIYKNIDIVLLGFFCTAKEVGIYAVASRIVILSGFLLNVTNSAVAPKFATLYQSNNLSALKKLVQFITLLLIIYSVVILIISIIFGKFILSVWGAEFINGYYIFIILACGQFFNVSSGSVGTILTMTGFEKKLLFVNTFFMFFNIILNLIFISLWGVIGAAFAYSISIFGMNFSRAFYVYKFVGINILPLKIIHK